jgi:ribonuclease M5
MIKEVIVVEGKEDTRRLKEVYKDIHTIETRGSAIDETTLRLIKKAQEERGVIIFTDPDYPGKRIRHIINQAVPGCKNAYIEKAKAISIKKKKVGVEHCSDQDIKLALSNMTLTISTPTTVLFNDLVHLGLVGRESSRALREYLGNTLNLGHNNAKQFYTKVKLFNIPLSRLEQLTNQFNELGRQ